MQMKYADKNRDQERARKRALSDFRCAMRKLIDEAEDSGETHLAGAMRGSQGLIESMVEQVRRRQRNTKEND